MKLIWNYLRQNQISVLGWLTGFLLLLQAFNLHSYVVATVDHQALVAVNDDDAGYNVGKVIKTRWWKDNGWVLYGPAYFRLNHSIHYFWHRSADPRAGGEQEEWERAAHHAVLTVSMLSIFGMALLIAAALLPLWWQRFVLAIGLTSAFASIPALVEFTLRAHPDLLFCFVMLAAFWLTVRMHQEPKERVWFWLSGSMWGIAMSVKMTVTLCVPGFVLLFIPPFTKERFKEGLRYLGVMTLAYFLIGFPQTIVLDRPIKALMKIQSISAPVTAESIHHWLYLFVTQGWGPLAVLVLGVLAFPYRKWAVPKGQEWRLWAFTLLPFPLMLGKNMMVPADHYPLAFIAILAFMFGAFLLSRLPFFPRPGSAVVRGSLLFAAGLAIFGSTPKIWQAQLQKRLACRSEAHEMLQRMKTFYAEGKNLWVDPYLPFLTTAPKDRLEVSWEKTWPGYDRGSWQVLALNRDFLSQFTAPGGPSEYTKADIPAWAAVREFYLPFISGDVATTPQGHTFKKIYENSCKQELWLRQ